MHFLRAALIWNSRGRAADEDELLARLRRSGAYAAAVDAVQQAVDQLQAWGVPADEAAVISGSTAASSLSGVVTIAWDQGATSTAAMQALVQHNRQRVLAAAPPHAQSCPLTVVGYAMKTSREQQLASQGLLPLVPQPLGPDGGFMCFMPIDLSRPLAEQGHIDVLLHKASDELVRSQDGSGALTWSEAMQQLQRQLEGRPEICVVDPFMATAKVIDRSILCSTLNGLHQLPLPGGLRARAPKHLIIDSLAAPGLAALLQTAGLSSGALLVKPLVACGLPESHSMALVLHPVALPMLAAGLGDASSAGSGAVVIQEFVNHGGLQYKAYAIGNRVFYATRTSIPDVTIPTSAAAAAAAAAGPAALERFILRFDSLSSLPTQLPDHMASSRIAQQQQAGQPYQQHLHEHQAQGSRQQQRVLDQGALEAVAGYIGSQLGLALFGFDIVVSTSSGEWLVVDVNYFPNYKGGPPETPAWLREALADALRHHRQRQP